MRRMIPDNEWNQVKTLAENAVPKTKKLYYHPIMMYKTGVFSISFVIINNSSTAFTPTTLKAFILDNNIRRISPCAGSFRTSSTAIYMTQCGWSNSGKIYLAGERVDTYTRDNLEITSYFDSSELSEYHDDVNEIYPNIV